MDCTGKIENKIIFVFLGGVIDLGEKPFDYDGPLLQLLKKEGAIPFVRCNMP